MKSLKEHTIAGVYVRKCLKEKHKVESSSRQIGSPSDGKIVVEKGIYGAFVYWLCRCETNNKFSTITSFICMPIRRILNFNSIIRIIIC